MTITLHAPQIIFLLWQAIVLIVATLEHGKPAGNYNVWKLFPLICAEIALLWWGGFFGGAR